MNEVRLSVALDEDADVPLPPGVDHESFERLTRHALEREGAMGEWEINLRLTSDDVIQEMHREFMGLDSPTDIMTFPFDDGGDFPVAESPGQGGDIVISVEAAARHAADAGWGLASELRFLVLHGLLHLLGWDDTSDVMRDAMLARQHALLAEWRAAQPRG